MFKRFLFAIVILVMIIPVAGCVDVDWILIDEGILTDLSEIRGRYAVTFDYTRISLLRHGYTFKVPAVITLGEYYYLYKEDGSAVWNGYHLVKDKSNGN